MDTIFINSGNSKTSGPHRLLLNLSNKINLKLVSAISYEIFIFSPNDSPQKLKNIFISSKKLFSFSRYSNVCNFSLPFHIFQIQKNKWKWNNL